MNKANQQIDWSVFPALAQLGLTDSESIALRRQGFVSRERRRGKVHRKLRFRVDGRQRVVYIADAQLADAVDLDLRRLQHWVRVRRRLAELHRVAIRQRRRMKVQLLPHLVAASMHWHGYSIRKSRLQKTPVPQGIDHE
jgi:hypothetical protein